MWNKAKKLLSLLLELYMAHMFLNQLKNLLKMMPPILFLRV